MLVGYVSVNILEQNLDRQIDALVNAGVDKRNMYQEKVTETNRERPQLQKMINKLQEGDIVVIVELTRLSRSIKDLFSIVEQIGDKKANIKSLKESWLDTTTTTGKTIFSLIAGISQFERDLQSERTKEGLVRARARGRQGGRPKKASEDIKKAIELYKSNQYSVKEIEEMTGVSKATLYRNINRRIKD